MGEISRSQQYMVVETFQLMECSDTRLLEQWTAGWSDLVDFEVVPVIPSADVAQRMEAKGSLAKG